MTLRSAGLAVAVGSPLLALYILGVILLLDLDSPSGRYALAVPVAIFLGFVPWGFLLHQLILANNGTRRADPMWLASFIAALDAGKGFLSVTLGWAALGTTEGTTAAGLAVLAGDVTSRVLFRHGRSGPVSVGALLTIAWLPGVIVVASVPIALLLGALRGLPGGLLVALAVIVAPLVMALLDRAEHVHLLFAGPAAALMLLQYHRACPRTAVEEATDPTRPTSTSPP